MTARQNITYKPWGPGWDLKRNRRAFDVDVNGKPTGGFIEKDVKTGKWFVPYDNDDAQEKKFSTRIAAARYVISLGRYR